MKIRFLPQFLRLSEAGDGDGGGGGTGGSTTQTATQTSGTTTQSQAPPQTTNQSQTGGEAPVTRAEFDALMAKIDKLGQPPAPPQPPTSPEPPKNQPPADMPEWARGLVTTVEGLAARAKSDDIAGRKRQLIDGALAGVPDTNRALATAALEGLLASSGVRLDAAEVNVQQVAEQLAGQLRAQFGGQLYSVPGSPYKAIPVAPNGGFDWSAVQTMNDVPPEMIKHIPDDVYARIRFGGTASGALPGGGVIPRNRFHDPRSQTN